MASVAVRPNVEGNRRADETLAEDQVPARPVDRKVRARWPLLTVGPVCWTTALMRERENIQLIGSEPVDHAIGKAAKRETP
jgi:hypothetical protein